MALKKKIDPKDYEAAFLFNHFLRSCYGRDEEGSEDYYQERPFDEKRKERKESIGDRWVPGRSPLDRWALARLQQRVFSPPPGQPQFIFDRQQHPEGKMGRIEADEETIGRGDDGVRMPGNQKYSDKISEISKRLERSRISKDGGGAGVNRTDVPFGEAIYIKKFRKPSMDSSGEEPETNECGKEPKVPVFLCTYCRKKFVARIELVEHLLELHSEKQ